MIARRRDSADPRDLASGFFLKSSNASERDQRQKLSIDMAYDDPDHWIEMAQKSAGAFGFAAGPDTFPACEMLQMASNRLQAQPSP
jgi:hypothetical protein